MTGRLRSHRVRGIRKPCRRRRRVVVDDVVDASPPAFDRGEGRACSVLDVDERGHATAVADDRERTLADRLDALAVFGERRARPVEAAVAQDDAVEFLRRDDALLEIADRRDRLLRVACRGRVESGVFVLNGRALARQGPARIALSNELPRPDPQRGGEQVVRSLRAKPVRLRERLVELPEAPADAAERGRLVDETSGSASEIARPTASASSRSRTTGCAPSARRVSSFRADVVVPTTSWPASASSGTSCLPSTPDAPATKILIASSFRSVRALRRGRPDLCDMSQAVVLSRLKAHANGGAVRRAEAAAVLGRLPDAQQRQRGRGHRPGGLPPDPPS